LFAPDPEFDSNAYGIRRASGYTYPKHLPREAIALNANPINAKKLERDLRAELAGAGVAWRSLKLVLPGWAETAFDTNSGVLELKTFLSRNIGLQVGPDGTLKTKELPAACFKTNVATSVEQVKAARSVATACARLVVKATKLPYIRLPEDPDVFRSTILRGSNKAWLDLPVLLSACWSHGVPVLYMPFLPVEGRKMEGMVTNVGGRPVIILTKKVPHPDWLLFLLAHEIGHLAKGHLPDGEGQAIVDDTVDLTIGDDRDQQEREANEFATHLLAPEGKEVRFGGRLPNAMKLATEANEYGIANRMAPGYVILNAVHNSSINGKKPFGLGQAALKLLAANAQQSAADFCKTAMREHVEFEMLRNYSTELLENLDLL
jgi:hypothetical protein